MSDTPAAGGEPTMRILHVEDEDLNRRLLRAILERAEDDRLRTAIVEEAPDLQTARSILTDGVPDLVLLDVRLPDGNGLDFLRELRSEHQSARVVVMSASVLATERAEAIRAGCDAFIAKPYTATELTGVLGKVMFGAGEAIDPSPAGS
jgi:CheY-like chemotaxis protein